MSGATDVVVVGGGIIGCSTAYQLAKRGARVTVLERESIGCEASGVATGLISVMSIDSPGPYLNLARASVELYKTLAPELREASGIEFYYGEMDWLDLAFTEEDEAENREAMSWKKGLVARASWLSGDDVRRLEPRASTEARSGAHYEGMAQADAYRLTLAIARSAESLGVEIRYANATGLATHGDRVTGVRTPGGVVGCDAVVLAMGAWASLAEPWIGRPVPVEPFKGQLVHLKLSGPPIACNLHHGDTYVTAKLNGSILAGSFDGFEGFDKAVSKKGTRQIVEDALTLCPGMQDAVVEAEVTGLRPSTPDEIPILGPVPGLAGAFIATGHRRKGITLAAITGELMAQLVSGQEPGIPLGSFGLARFDQGASGSG